MSIIDLILIAIGLSMDACAVSLAAGSSGQANTRRACFRIPFHFGLFQFLMPIVGWALGQAIEPIIAAFDHWVAFALLTWVGVRIIRASFDPDPLSRFKRDPSRGLTLVMLSVATSIDALAVGLSLAVLDVNIWTASILIGVVTGFLSLIGLRLGRRLGGRFGGVIERAGGILLIAIGVRILIGHLFF